MYAKINIVTENQNAVEAIAPVIISASRRTDIPAFYSEWFINSIKRGYCIWVNPFNQKYVYISFNKTKVVVFWTKNPEPIIPYLNELEKRDIHFYFQFTLNDYEKEKLEPNIPNIEERVDIFKKLSEKIGKEKVIWRFDPLILTDNLGVEELLKRIDYIGNKLNGYTEKLVFSFADITNYKKVANNFKKQNINYADFTHKTMLDIAKGIHDLNKNWHYKLASCAEIINLEQFEIEHNKCIDNVLIKQIVSKDKNLVHYLTNGRFQANNTLCTNKNYQKPINLKDKGQRKNCKCIISKDIGIYNTCPHLCTYCYANGSTNIVIKNYKSHSPNHESIVVLK